ncbi:MAG: integrin alpha, partial [Planctomycetaceae bacterium]
MLLFNWLNSVRHCVGRRARQRRALVGQRSMTTSRRLGITTVDVAPKIEGLEGRQLLTTIDLAALTAAQGTTIFGADADDQSGRSVSSAGDVNGDGFDDLLIGAYQADASGNAKSSAGESYVIFGGASLPATIDLASLGTAGITLFGADPYDRSGTSVSSAGDVNGDGFDDLLIGAERADASGNAKNYAGESYVIFGG